MLGRDLPEGIKMNNAVVEISDNCCTTYECNYSDKTVRLSNDCNFCDGIVIINSLITIDKHTFTSAIDIDKGRKARELNNLRFQEHRASCWKFCLNSKYSSI